MRLTSWLFTAVTAVGALPLDVVDSVKVIVPRGLSPREAISVLISRKAYIYSSIGDVTSQAVSNFMFDFDLTAASDLVTIPGLPLKLHPINTSKVSTFAAILPKETDGYFDVESMSEDDDDEQRYEPLLWKDYQDELDASAELIVESFEDSIVVTVHSTIQDKRLDDIEIKLDETEEEPLLPGSAHASATKLDTGDIPVAAKEDSIKDAIYRYYRGPKLDYKCYDRLAEISEYLQTAVVSFLSPFVMLAFLFACSAVAVFVWLHGYRDEMVDGDTADNESQLEPVTEKQIFLV